MFEAVYMAATGLMNQQKRLDTIGDNVANVNTAGFKAARLDFKDALYTAGYNPGPAYTESANQQKGHGVMVAAITNEFTTGALQTTDNMLDFAIEGDAFFEVVDSFGNRLYTSAGNFYLAGMELVNANGYFVQDENGNNIVAPEGTTMVSVSETGQITFSDGENELDTVQLGLYTFSNRRGLAAAGQGYYTPTVASGDAETATDYKVQQYMLEASNVDLATEMTRLLRTQRAFQLASRALTTADEMEGIANNMRR